MPSGYPCHSIPIASRADLMAVWPNWAPHLKRPHTEAGSRVPADIASSLLCSWRVDMRYSMPRHCKESGVSTVLPLHDPPFHLPQDLLAHLSWWVEGPLWVRHPVKNVFHWTSQLWASGLEWGDRVRSRVEIWWNKWLDIPHSKHLLTCFHNKNWLARHKSERGPKKAIWPGANPVSCGY